MLFVVCQGLQQLLNQEFKNELIRQRDVFSLQVFQQLVVFVDLYLYVFFFVHSPTVVVGDDEYLFDHVLRNVFKYERVSYLFGFLVGAVYIEKIIIQGT